MLFFASTPPSAYEQTEISIQLRVHLMLYREVMPCSSDSLLRKEILETIGSLKDFLEREKESIFTTAEANGWPRFRCRNDPIGSGYENVYQSLMNSINNFMAKPNLGSSYMINEQLTQLYWLTTHSREYN